MIKKVKPTTPGRRGMMIEDFSEITKKKSQKSLTLFLKKKAGRNNQGKITIRHRGGGAKRLYRSVDFKQVKQDKAKVMAIEYDPNRSARIALLEFEDQSKAYVICPAKWKVGTAIDFGTETGTKIGMRLPLKKIPVGTFIYNIEISPGRGGQIARAAGTSVQLMGKEDRYGLLKLPSGEIRKILLRCKANIGGVGNPEHSLIKVGKAGRKRHMGIRPAVRGKAMNPSDHPHGGGEGRNAIGLIHPKTPWGAPALGYKTRKKQTSSRLIIKGRKK